MKANANDCVVLLHGLARSSDSMHLMQLALEKENFQVINFDYSSRKNTVEKLSETVIPAALAQCGENSTVHFVTHSLGGILVRYYLSQNQLTRLGRVVMLGPPNQGSQVVDSFKKIPGYDWINGPAGQELGTDENAIPKKLGKVEFPLGVIAGSRSINLILSMFLPNPDDGKVSVENTKVEGMADHLVVSVSHPFLMKDKKVIEQTIYFLKLGRFKHD